MANDVRIVAVEIPLWDMVVLIVKFSIALIPAGILLGIIFAIVVGVLGGISGTT